MATVKRTVTTGGRNSSDSGNMPRHRMIYEELLREIQTGIYRPGDRLPSEAALCARFDASRITVAKAFQTLQRENLVTRRPGSGTYVERPTRADAMQFGLLIPDLGTTEIFEPICQGIMRSPAARSHSLAWGHSVGREEDVIRASKDLCRQYIQQGVAGVFYAPTEYAAGRDAGNLEIAEMLERAGIAVVLLDRTFEKYPQRTKFDLVGIDNHRAGYLLGDHLMQAGAKRPVFAARRGSAPTVDARITGFREAVYAHSGKVPPVFYGEFENAKTVRQMLDKEKPDALLCQNDVTAAQVMQHLVSFGVSIPDDLMMAGVDDVSYAKFLPVPLTTIRQDCTEIGAIAMTTMLERLQRREGAIRDVRVGCQLVVRASTAGAKAE